MAMVNPMLNIANSANVKDSRWLTLEVCREYQRNKCTRSDTECKFAHPPAHVEVQNGRVTACFDSIKVSQIYFILFFKTLKMSSVFKNRFSLYIIKKQVLYKRLYYQCILQRRVEKRDLKRRICFKCLCLLKFDWTF